VSVVVLDASAVLALIYREPGHEQVADALPGAVCSTVNWAEVVGKLAQREHPNPASAADAVRTLGVKVLPFTTTHAVAAGLLWPTTRAAGLSLGDRACLALAQATPESVAYTCDGAWATLDLPEVTVQQLR
jgi:PIN domain nuclease of toxin-antitoxin system